MSNFDTIRYLFGFFIICQTQTWTLPVSQATSGSRWHLVLDVLSH